MIVLTPNNRFSLTHTDLVLLFLVIIWELVFKALALWRAARNNQLSWFIVLSILNTLGILEIIYILFFQKKKP